MSGQSVRGNGRGDREILTGGGFQSPRCRGSRCGEASGYCALGAIKKAGFNPLGVGAVGAGHLRCSRQRAYGVPVSIPSVSGQSVRVNLVIEFNDSILTKSFNPLGVGAVGAGTMTNEEVKGALAGFQSPRCRGSRCGPLRGRAMRLIAGNGFNPLGVGAVGAGPGDRLRLADHGGEGFQSPRCRGSRCGAAIGKERIIEVLEFQSPRCRGSRCGGACGARAYHTAQTSFNPLGVGAVGAGCSILDACAGVEDFGFNPLGVGAVGAGPQSGERGEPQSRGSFNPLGVGAVGAGPGSFGS